MPSGSWVAACPYQPPLTKQDATEIAIDIWHSVVYAAAAGAAYEALNSTR